VSDKAISIVSAEWEALAGLPYLQVRLYLVLRWYMSMATGRVGDARGISLQSLSEELYVEPAPGRSDSGSPTKKAVRSALEQLAKHGLAQPCGNGEVLVFFLPKAGSALTRPKTKGHKRGTVYGHAMGHGQTEVEQGFKDAMGHAIGHGVNGLKGHTSEVRVNHPCKQAAAAASSVPVDNLSTVLVLPLLPEMIAEWIRRQELSRGCRSRVISKAPQIAEWLAFGMTGDELQEAYRLAKADRDATQNRGAIPLGFLDIFVRRVIDARAVCREAVAHCAAPVWWSSAAGIAAKARQLGIDPIGGETSAQLRGRVDHALMLLEDAARQQRKAAAGKRAGKEVAHG
jgi:hypothetical protein